MRTRPRIAVAIAIAKHPVRKHPVREHPVGIAKHPVREHPVWTLTFGVYD